MITVIKEATERRKNSKIHENIDSEFFESYCMKNRKIDQKNEKSNKVNETLCKKKRIWNVRLSRDKKRKINRTKIFCK